MTDRELLEYAAKAAGIEGRWMTKGDSDLWLFRNDFSDPWNPLTNDDDAFRLVVRLKIDLVRDFDRIDIVYGNGEAVSEYLYDLPTPTDPYAATRRAIVRAAAEIGKGMV